MFDIRTSKLGIKRVICLIITAPVWLLVGFIIIVLSVPAWLILTFIRVWDYGFKGKWDITQ